MTVIKFLVPAISALIAGTGACILKIRASSKKEGRENLERHLDIINDLHACESEIQNLKDELSDSSISHDLYIERVKYIEEYLDLIDTKVKTRSIVFDMNVDMMEEISQRVENALEICYNLKEKFNSLTI